jgi:hypothetical protein
MRIAGCLLAWLTLTLCASAQGPTPSPAPVQNWCWLGNMAYSPGATIRASDGVMICQPDFTWALTKRDSSGCVAEGRFYNVGAFENGPRSDSVRMQCLPDGSWEIVPRQ